MACVNLSCVGRERFEDDLSLVEACIKRDIGAWSVFVKKYSGLISISIKNRVKRYGIALSGEEIEDIRQDVLGLLWKEKKLEDVRNRANITYWLAVVSGNVAIGYLRKKHTDCPVRTISIFDKINEKEVAELLPSPGPGAADELSKNELSGRIEETIESLPQKEKLVIKLELFHGKKYHEIADILNLPPGTVSSYIKRAKEKLRQELKDFK